jgi:hypothetical protein
MPATTRPSGKALKIAVKVGIISAKIKNKGR